METGGAEAARIGTGLLVLLGVTHTDTDSQARRLADKVVRLRILDDEAGRMNRSVSETGGEVLCVSQFTLYADTRRGNRPSYDAAAPGRLAEPLYEAFCSAIEAAGVHCRRGQFGAEMLVQLANDGPVTIVLDTDDLDAPRRA